MYLSVLHLLWSFADVQLTSHCAVRMIFLLELVGISDCRGSLMGKGDNTMSDRADSASEDSGMSQVY